MNELSTRRTDVSIPKEKSSVRWVPKVVVNPICRVNFLKTFEAALDVCLHRIHGGIFLLNRNLSLSAVTL